MLRTRLALPDYCPFTARIDVVEFSGHAVAHCPRKGFEQESLKAKASLPGATLR